MDFTRGSLIVRSSYGMIAGFFYKRIWKDTLKIVVGNGKNLVYDVAMEPIPSHVSSFLASNFLAIVSTVGGQTVPHTSLVYYTVFDDGGKKQIVFITNSKSRKFQQLEENKQMSMLVYSLSQMQTLELSGMAEIIEDGEKVSEWLSIVSRKAESLNDGWLPLLKTKGVSFRAVVMTIQEWWWSDYSD